MTITTCVFDAYGTLFDVAAAAQQAAAQPGNERLAGIWPKLASDWRLKQLQYSWLHAIANSHCDFWEVTENGLDWALEAAGLNDPELRETLLALYWELTSYPEVPEVLAQLQSAGLNTAILSNGTPEMLAGAVDSAGIRAHLHAVLSVHSVGVFKPHHAVYDLVGKQFDCQPDQVLFVSSNGWDAAAATGYGFTTAWINRANEPIDRMPWTPTHVLSDLKKIPDLAARL